MSMLLFVLQAQVAVEIVCMVGESEDRECHRQESISILVVEQCRFVVSLCLCSTMSLRRSFNVLASSLLPSLLK